MLPAASRLAVAPGGTTQVASYSSMMNGPRRCAGEIGAAQRSACRASRRRRNRRGAAAAGCGSARLGFSRSGTPASPRRRPWPDDLDRHQLDRLVLAGAMAVGLLVLLAERLLEMRDHARIDRAVGHRHGELVALALVVQRRRAAQPHAVGREVLGGELRAAPGRPAPSTPARSRRDRPGAAAGGRCANSGARRRRRAGRTTRTARPTAAPRRGSCRATAPCRRRTTGRCRRRRTARTRADRGRARSRPT